MVTISIDDGTNVITNLIDGFSTTTSGAEYNFPFTGAPGATGTPFNVGSSPSLIISGTERLVLKVQTVAVSVTQTFAVALRFRGGPPNSTLADTVGTPVLTFNTQAAFG